MNSRYLEIKENLKKYNQEHLLKFYDELNVEEKESLLEDISSINFEQVKNLYEDTKKNDKFVNDKIEPISYIDKEKMLEEEKQYYTKIGEQCIKSGEYAVITMAGGQRNKIRSQWAKRNF